jgi:hypothetical protein
MPLGTEQSCFAFYPVAIAGLYGRQKSLRYLMGGRRRALESRLDPDELPHLAKFRFAMNCN